MGPKKMRRLCVLLILGLLTAGTALAESVMVTRPWTRVRREPSEKAGAIVIVYANDTLTVLGTSGNWIKVRTASKVEGWVAAADTARGEGPSMASGSGAGSGARGAEARQASGRARRDAGI